MVKKRAQIERRRQLQKARASQRSRSSASRATPPKSKADDRGHRDTWIAVGVIALLALVLLALYLLGVIRPSREKPAAQSWREPPAMQIDLDKTYEADVATEQGMVRIELYDDLAPNTVNNFVFLARQGFYNGVTFHRVIPSFMAQTGDPSGTGAGGPGYTFADEIAPTLRHDGPGVVSMANSGPNISGSQFFITYAATPHLDGLHTVFGHVIEGMEVVEALSARDPAVATTPGDRILSVSIVEH